MQTPIQGAPVEIGDGIFVLPAYMPVPGRGVLSANSFLIDGAEPLLVDTGIAPLAGALAANLTQLLPVEQLRFIWLTHMDADHVGGLPPLLEAAPQARIVTNFLGAGKLGLLGLPADRVTLLSPGDTLRLGGRALRAIRPPTFDAPETMGLWDPASATLFSADAFGALLPAPIEAAEALAADLLRNGIRQWAEIDSPWLAHMDESRFHDALRRFGALGARTVLSSHLPAASAITGDLLAMLGLVQRELAAQDGARPMLAA